MKRLKILACLAILTTLPGCTADCKNELKHFKSDMVGLNRKITLYTASGSKLREWETTAKVEDKGGTCYFLTSDDKAVIVSGTFVIEEK